MTFIQSILQSWSPIYTQGFLTTRSLSGHKTIRLGFKPLSLYLKVYISGFVPNGIEIITPVADITLKTNKLKLRVLGMGGKYIKNGIRRYKAKSKWSIEPIWISHHRLILKRLLTAFNPFE